MGRGGTNDVASAGLGRGGEARGPVGRSGSSGSGTQGGGRRPQQGLYPSYTSNFGPTWAFLLNVVAAHLPDLAPTLSRATPLRLHRSGYFCATADSDEACQALMRRARDVELLLVQHGVPALGYRMGIGWEPGTSQPVPLRTCDILHLP